MFSRREDEEEKRPYKDASLKGRRGAIGCREVEDVLLAGDEVCAKSKKREGEGRAKKYSE